MTDQVSFTIAVYTPPTQSVINAIRVQDIARDLWYSWDVTEADPSGSWDNAGGTGTNAPAGQTPQVEPGISNLYIAFNAVNMGLPGNITLTLADSSGNVLATTTVQNVATGGNAGLEWTGTMPDSAYGIVVTSSP